MAAGWDADAVFDEDYLHFYEPVLTPERSDAEAERAWSLLGLAPGQAVLDCPCGHGRLASRLALRGARVTGVDRAGLFLEQARADAARLGAAVEYVEGDMRALPWRGAFDAVLCWFTSFGYFDDATNREVLRGFRAALRAGGRLLLETQHLPALMAGFSAQAWTERDGDYLLDSRRYVAETGRVETDRVVVRAGRTRRAPFSVRVFAFPELRDWLLDAGFEHVAAYGEDGAGLAAGHRRMLVVARAPG